MVVKNGGVPLDLAVEEIGRGTGGPVPVDDYVYLAGRPPLRGYLHFMEDVAQNGVKRRALVEEWRAAASLIEKLETEEAGWADEPPIHPLGAHLEPLRRELQEDPIFQKVFDHLPTEIAVVELDRMIVYQKHINLTYATMLRERLGPAPGEEALFRACLPADHPNPETRWMQIHSDTWACISPSNDMRFLDTVLLQPAQVLGYAASGPLSGVVAAMVGYGSNFLNAFHAEGRLVLNNGSHRAYALREMGFTHVPCIIQHFSSREEVMAFGSSELRRRPDLYLRHSRPPLLKDYLDSRLRSTTRAPRRLRQVRVTVRVEEAEYPVF